MKKNFLLTISVTFSFINCNTTSRAKPNALKNNKEKLAFYKENRLLLDKNAIIIDNFIFHLSAIRKGEMNNKNLDNALEYYPVVQDAVTKESTIFLYSWGGAASAITNGTLGILGSTNVIRWHNGWNIALFATASISAAISVYTFLTKTPRYHEIVPMYNYELRKELQSIDNHHANNKNEFSFAWSHRF